MTILKVLEQELIMAWQSLQIEQDAAVKANALKAYFEKYRLYRRERSWQLELHELGLT